jgi:hypothetical protein
MLDMEQFSQLYKLDIPFILFNAQTLGDIPGLTEKHLLSEITSQVCGLHHIYVATKKSFPI